MDFISQLHYLDSFPEEDQLSGAVFIYDQRLLQVSKPVEAWLKSRALSYPVIAGEELKDIKNFAEHITQILELVDQSSQAKPSLVAIGGGSLGDFVGFAASCIKRGIGFIQMPTTLLSAIDSAHGGKTALNVDGAKNQIGSFYPPKDVFVVKQFFKDLPLDQRKDGYGELFKMGLLRGGEFWDSLKPTNQLDLETLWQLLPGAVEGKYEVIEKDPYEALGIRHCLNLGHTMGHVWEAEFQISHGKAVALGIIFALKFSAEREYLSPEKLREIEASPAYQLLLDIGSEVKPAPIAAARLEQLLKKDKKRAGDGLLYFIFMNGPGFYQSEQISYKELISEARRQGHVR